MLVLAAAARSLRSVMGNENKTYVGESGNGKGVFAKGLIKKGEQIMKFHGQILELQDLPDPYESVEDYYVQIGNKLYMGPSGKEDDLVNHSCNPNSGLFKDKKIVLVAIKDIKKGEEITWDYSTTMNEDDWEINCKCGSVNCRGKIQDFKHLPIKVKEKYVELNIVPEYNLKYLSYGAAVSSRNAMESRDEL